MGKVISIGKQNFASLRENDCFYIDKSELIREWWESQDDITLVTRPRRFGKTLNMSMLNCFFPISMPKRSSCLKDCQFGTMKSIAAYRKLSCHFLKLCIDKRK